MLGRTVRAAVAAALLACAPASAADPSYQVSDPPPPCDDALFSDQIGTNGRDVLTAQTRPQRLWGLAGDDRLTGSATRATCAFGGRGDDVLDLADGGGIAWGEDGSDWLRGGPLADTLDGGAGVDGFEAGDGSDKLDAQDGNAEVVDCGPGQDIVDADRGDLLLGCETAIREGKATPALPTSPRAVGRRRLVILRFRVPEAATAGAYRVLLTSGARKPAGCAAGPLELTRLPEPGRRVRVRQAVRVGLHPPAGGWCTGLERAVVIYQPGCSRGCAQPSPAQPIGRLRFRVR